MEFSMIGQYQAVYNQFIRNNHREMNQEGYTHTSFCTQVPATSTSTNTKKRSYKESDTDTTEQFPKMFNVELLLTSNQAQCKPEMDGSQRSEKDKMEQFQQRVKQMKRKITKDLEKFSRNIEQYEKKYPGDYEMDQTGSVMINNAKSILKEQQNIKDRYRKLENEVEKFQNLLSDIWEQSEDELETIICRNRSEFMHYEKKFLEMSRNNEVVLERYNTACPCH